MQPSKSKIFAFTKNCNASVILIFPNLYLCIYVNSCTHKLEKFMEEIKKPRNNIIYATFSIIDKQRNLSNFFLRVHSQITLVIVKEVWEEKTLKFSQANDRKAVCPQLIFPVTIPIVVDWTDILKEENAPYPFVINEYLKFLVVGDWIKCSRFFLYSFQRCSAICFPLNFKFI